MTRISASLSASPRTEAEAPAAAVEVSHRSKAGPDTRTSFFVNYTIIRELQKGHYGRTFKCCNQEDGEICVVKENLVNCVS